MENQPMKLHKKFWMELIDHEIFKKSAHTSHFKL